MTYDFNPRSRKGSDTMPPPSPSQMMHFNPRSRKGSDTRKPSQIAKLT